ncbi:MAG: hypothetical protein GY795_45045 [Desulfobacterales bacterium]|nr:hypothetical protein [Desulfobacterales bacterium]
MMKRIIIFVIVMFCALEAAAETPQEGATAILKLLKGRNYSDLFQQRYSEWHKVEARGIKPEEAVKKLSAMWEKNYDMLVKLFEQLAKAEFELTKREKPQKTETGDIATATVTIGEKKIPYRLYKMKNGLWGFHI